jgi:MATE family multidrug resistance protein
MALAIPLVIARAGGMFMGVVDTWMAGQVSKEAVAALGLGNTCFWLAAVAALGLLGGQDPVVSQAVGANDRGQWEAAFNAARWLAVALAVPAVVACLVGPSVLVALDQPAHLIPMIERYLWILAGAMPLFLLYVVHASYMSAHNQTRAFAWITVGANIVNVFGNLALTRGMWGFPALGVQGIAISTLFCFGFQLVCVVALLRGPLKRLWVRWARPHLEVAKEVVRLGLPISAQSTLEFTGFGVAIMFMGWISADAVAGHQVALNVASFTFTFAMGVGAAVSVRVGQAVGRRDLAGVRAAGWTAWQAGVVFALLSGVALIALRWPLAGAYGLSGEAQAVAAKLLYIAAFFQLADIGQAIGFGILRGMGDTRMPAVFNAVSYWGLGVPFGYMGAFYWWPARGPELIWWGLSIALFLVATALVRRFWRRTQDPTKAFAFASALKADPMPDREPDPA